MVDETSLLTITYQQEYLFTLNTFFFLSSISFFFFSPFIRK